MGRAVLYHAGRECTVVPPRSLPFRVPLGLRRANRPGPFLSAMATQVVPRSTACVDRWNGVTPGSGIADP